MRHARPPLPLSSGLPRRKPPPPPRARPRPWPWLPEAAGLPRRRRLLRSAPSAMRASVPALGGARRGSRSAAAAPELLSKVLQAPRPRPPLGRLRRRRAPAGARTSTISLPGARAAQAPARTGLVLPGSWGCRRAQHQPRARRLQGCGREPEAPVLAAPQRGPGLLRRWGLAASAPSRPWGGPLPHTSPPAQRGSSSCGSSRTRVSKRARAGGETPGRGGAGNRSLPQPRPDTCCLCSRRGARSCGPRGRSLPSPRPSDAGSTWAEAATEPYENPRKEAASPSTLLPFNIPVP